MLLNFYIYIIFYPLIFISSVMIIFSNSWFSQWMIMEVNLISFIGLMMFDKFMNPLNSMNYFLIQSVNSYIFILMSMNLNFLNLFVNPMILFMMNLSMLTKMGLPPFYIWYMKMVKNLNWKNLFLLLTIQKIIPMFILNNLMNFKNSFVLMFNLIILTFMSMICAILGLQILNLKMLFGYSSIIQMTWIVFLMYLNEIIWMSYFLIYSIISLSLIYTFNKFNMNYLNDLNLNILNYKIWMNLFIMINMMSLASIPPFFGFLMKWISIQNLSNGFSFFLNFFMILNSLISIYFYMRLIFNNLVLNYMSFKFNFIKLNYEINLSVFLIFSIWLSLILILIYEIF